MCHNSESWYFFLCKSPQGCRVTPTCWCFHYGQGPLMALAFKECSQGGDSGNALDYGCDCASDSNDDNVDLLDVQQCYFVQCQYQWEPTLSARQWQCSCRPAHGKWPKGDVIVEQSFAYIHFPLVVTITLLVITFQAVSVLNVLIIAKLSLYHQNLNDNWHEGE